MTDVRALISGEAELGSDSDDESFKEGMGKAKSKRNGADLLDDSSEEESDGDEEAARQVCGSLHDYSFLNSYTLWQVREGFIVEDEEEPEERARRKKEKKRRRKEERQEEEANLDAEDLDLIVEAHPELDQRTNDEVGFTW